MNRIIKARFIMLSNHNTMVGGKPNYYNLGLVVINRAHKPYQTVITNLWWLTIIFKIKIFM